MTDLSMLLPHSKRDNKLDTKNDRGLLNEVADMKGCSSIMFFEVRKKTDLYMWLAKTPEGPSIKVGRLGERRDERGGARLK